MAFLVIDRGWGQRGIETGELAGSRQTEGQRGRGNLRQKNKKAEVFGGRRTEEQKGRRAEVFGEGVENDVC